MSVEIFIDFAGAWAVLAVVMATLWIVQRKTGDAGIVDVAWTFGVGAAGVYFAFTGDGPELRRIMLGTLAAIWSLRLGSHLLFDRILGDRPEDGRYKALRTEWGDGFQKLLFWFFQFQALSIVILAVPFRLVAVNARPVGALDYAAVALFALAILGEGIADRQLATFRSNADNRGKTCRHGLWRVSRHPNYFFEWLHWLSYPLLAIGADMAWLAWIAPALLLFLVLKVTGIPPTEEQALRSRGDDYRRYQATTSAFFPWFPKRVEDPKTETAA